MYFLPSDKAVSRNSEKMMKYILVVCMTVYSTSVGDQLSHYTALWDEVAEMRRCLMNYFAMQNIQNGFANCTIYATHSPEIYATLFSNKSAAADNCDDNIQIIFIRDATAITITM